MVVDKELLKFAFELLAQIIDMLDPIEAVIANIDGYQPIVPLNITLVFLLALNHADQSAAHSTARKRRLIHQYQDIKRISISGPSRWHKSKVVWKCHPGWQNHLQRKNAFLGIKGILVPRAFRRFNHNNDQLRVVGLEGVQLSRIRQRTWPSILAGSLNHACLPQSLSKLLQRSALQLR